MPEKYNPISMPFAITEGLTKEELLFGLDRNFKAIEQFLSLVMRYENVTGIPVNTAVDHSGLSPAGILPTSSLSDKLVGLAHDLQLADLAVTTAKIAIGAVTEVKISDDAISAPKIQANAVTTAKLDALAVTAEKIAAGTITVDKLKADEILSNWIFAGTVQGITGSFGSLLAGSPTGARLEMGESSGSPYLKMYDADEIRVELLQDKLAFNYDGAERGYIRAYDDPAYGLNHHSLEIRSPYNIDVRVQVTSPSAATAQLMLEYTGMAKLRAETTIWGEYWLTVQAGVAVRRISGTDNLGIYPVPDNTLDLGTPTYGWRFLYMTGSIKNKHTAVNEYHGCIGTSTSGNPQTGTLLIGLPSDWSNTMMKVRIEGYDYSTGGSWSVVVSGYNFSGSGGFWTNGTCEIYGSPPSDRVRLARHTGLTRNVILLGITTTQWRYPKIVVTDVIAGHSNMDGWESGWTMSFITSEVSIEKAYNVDGNMRSPRFNSSGDVYFPRALYSGATQIVNTSNRVPVGALSSTTWSASGTLSGSTSTGLVNGGADDIATGGRWPLFPNFYGTHRFIVITCTADNATDTDANVQFCTRNSAVNSRGYSLKGRRLT